MVAVALATGLGVQPSTKVRALTVAVVVNVKASVYAAEFSSGTLPSRVYLMVASRDACSATQPGR